MSNADLVITCRCGVGKPRFLLRWDIGNNEWRFTGDPSEFLAAHSGWEGDCKLMFYVDEGFRAATAWPSAPISDGKFLMGQIRDIIADHCIDFQGCEGQGSGAHYVMNKIMELGPIRRAYEEGYANGESSADAMFGCMLNEYAGYPDDGDYSRWAIINWIKSLVEGKSAE